MSYYQTIWLELTCERCGIVHETVVRFRGERRDDTEYNLGENVIEGTDVKRGETYEGNADRYCWPCLCSWTYAQVGAEYESLTELVAQGQLIIRAEEGGPPLSADQVQGYGQRYINSLIEAGYPTAPVSANFKDLLLSWKGQPIAPPDDLYGDLLVTLEALVDEKLKAAGWRGGTKSWKDFRVYLDSESRIMVEELNSVGHAAV